MTLTDTLDHLLSVFLRPLHTWIEREFIVPWRAAYDAAMQTKEQYRDGVYLHLRERLEGTDEHPLAEGVPVRPLPQPQDLAHLQAAVELLGTRKIDTGSLTDGVPDGVSLVRLLCDSSLASTLTELKDTNSYVYDRPNYINTLQSIFTNLRKVTMTCKKVAGKIVREGNFTEINLPDVEDIDVIMGYYDGAYYNPSIHTITLPSLRKLHSSQNTYGAALLFSTVSKTTQYRIEIPSIEEIASDTAIISDYAQDNVFAGTTIFLGCKGNRNQVINVREIQGGGGSNTCLVEDVEIGEGARQPIVFYNFNRLTAENIVNHILNRLADNNDGDPITITLGSTNLAKLTDEEKHIAIDKNYILA